jgi:hypothetical protein
LLDMLAAIELKDHACFQAGKITNVGTDGVLSPKPEPSQLTVTQVLPKQTFRVCRVFPEFSYSTEHSSIVVHS